MRVAGHAVASAKRCMQNTDPICAIHRETYMSHASISTFILHFRPKHHAWIVKHCKPATPPVSHTAMLYSALGSIVASQSSLCCPSCQSNSLTTYYRDSYIAVGHTAYIERRWALPAARAQQGQHPLMRPCNYVSAGTPTVVHVLVLHMLLKRQDKRHRAACALSGGRAVSPLRLCQSCGTCDLPGWVTASMKRRPFR